MATRRELVRLGVAEAEPVPKWRLGYPLHSRNGRIGYKSSSGRSIFPRTPAYTLDEFRRDEEYRVNYAIRKRMYGKAAPPMDLYHQPKTRVEGLPGAVPQMAPALDKIRTRLGTKIQESDDERHRKLGFTHGFKKKKRSVEKSDGDWLPEGTAFFCGMPVEVNWKGQGQWYTGKISRINLDYKNGGDTTFDVRFEWGVPLIQNVEKDCVRPIAPRLKWFKGQTIIVNHLGKGVWFTAKVAHCHNEKHTDEGTIDIKYDSGWPAYLTRVPFEYAKHIQWHVGQPVLGNYKGKGRWCKAIIEKCQGNVIWGDGIVTLRYVEWGDDRIETGMTQDCLRPRLVEDFNLMPGPGQHLISLVLTPQERNNEEILPEKAFKKVEKLSSSSLSVSVAGHFEDKEEDDAASDQLISTAWFWRGAKMLPVSSSESERKDNTNNGWMVELPLSKKRFSMPIRITSMPPPSKYSKYNSQGHFVPKPKQKLNSFEQIALEKQAAFKNRERARLLEERKNQEYGQSSPAMLAISGPDALPLKRRGGGMERITLTLPHSFLKTVGMNLPKYAMSIDAVKTEKSDVRFYLTVKPGNGSALRKYVQTETKGVGTVVPSSTKDIRKFQALSTDIVTALNETPSFSSNLLSKFEDVHTERSETAVVDTDSRNLLNACNFAQKGNVEKLTALLDAEPNLIHQRQIKSGRTILQAAAFGGNVGVVRLLLKLGADPNIKDFSESMATDLARNRAEVDGLPGQLRKRLKFIAGLCDQKSIFRACLEDDQLRVGVLLEENPSIIFKQNIHGMTPLHYAVMYRHIRLVEILTARGSDWSVANVIGQTCTDLLWDITPAVGANTRALEAEEALKKCRLQEDVSRKNAAKALREVRDADGGYLLECAEERLKEARKLHQINVEQTEAAEIHLDVSRSFVGEDVAKAMHDLVQARERGLACRRREEPVVLTAKIIAGKIPWAPTSSPKRAAEHALYSRDMNDKLNWQSRPSRIMSMQDQRTFGVSNNNVFSTSNTFGSISPSALGKSSYSRPKTADFVYASKNSSAVLSIMKRQNKKGQAGQVSVPMRGYASIPGTEHGKPATIPWPPPLDSPIFETWINSIAGRGLERALAKDELDNKWSMLHGKKKR